MRKWIMGAAAAIGAATMWGATASATSTTATLDFENAPYGNVTSVLTEGGEGPIPVAAFDVAGPVPATVLAYGSGRALGVPSTTGYRRVHLRLGDAALGDGVTLHSFRIAGTTDAASVLFFDRGGNYGPAPWGIPVAATGASGSRTLTLTPADTGLADGAVAEVVVFFQGVGGVVDDFQFDLLACGCDEPPPPGDEPGIALTKTASPETAAPGQPVTYSYAVTNTGGVTLTNVVVTDDNATPDDASDDLTVGTIATLAPGATQTLSRTITPTVTAGSMCVLIGGVKTQVGTLSIETLPSGDHRVTYVQSRDVVDNTYGVNATGYARHHNFKDLVGSDKAEFRFTDGAGRVVLDFFADYVSASRAYPSGYGTLGVTGGDGKMVKGSAADVLSVTTSITDSLNQSPAFYGYTTDSPAPEASFPTWTYEDSYTVVVRGSAFGAAGLGSVSIPVVHNSPPKQGDNALSPEPCDSEVTNVATATATAGAQTVTATDSATVVVTANPVVSATDSAHSKSKKRRRRGRR